VTERPVTLEEVLLNREQRVLRQREALVAFSRPLLSITLVNPGPVKDSAVARQSMTYALGALDELLADRGWPVLDRQVRFDPTGPEALFVADAEARALKQAATHLEENHPLGRLWDIDVIDPLRGAISRKDLDQPARRCLLCDQDAHACVRSRAHSLLELQRVIQRMVDAYRKP
jgi:holo-ACP synthase